MNKKRRMAQDKLNGFIELDPNQLANLYSNKANYTVTYTSKKVIIDDFVNSLHEMQLEYIDEAVERSDLKEANELIKYIKSK